VRSQQQVLLSHGSLLPFQAYVDGTVFSQAPLSSIQAGRVAPVPMLVGATADEYDAFCLSRKTSILRPRRVPSCLTTTRFERWRELLTTAGLVQDQHN
jgi:carboxylesterase type B